MSMNVLAFYLKRQSVSIQTPLRLGCKRRSVLSQISKRFLSNAKASFLSLNFTQFQPAHSLLIQLIVEQRQTLGFLGRLSTLSVPLHKASSICFFSSSSAAISFFQLFEFLPFLEGHAALVVQTDTLRLFFLGLGCFLFVFCLGQLPVAVVRIVAGEIADVALSFEYQQMVYHLVHEVAVVAHHDDASP